ncbi:hypothetical protein B5F74_03160 [Collinsella sp. An271]|nr:hypothetical protein B5F74_03160 [Collinsella sp. An271]
MEDDSTDCTRIIQVVTASYFISYWVLVFADSTGAIDLFVRIPLPPVDLVLTSASVSLTLPAAIHLAWRSGAAGGALTGLFGAFGGIGILSMPRTLVAFGPGWQLPSSPSMRQRWGSSCAPSRMSGGTDAPCRRPSSPSSPCSRSRRSGPSSALSAVSQHG